MMRKPDLISKTINFALDISSYKKKLDPAWWQAPSSQSEPPAYFKEQFELNYRLQDGHKIWEISSFKATSEKAILFIHGGGFTKSFMKFHWNLIREFGKKLDQDIIAPDYPLLPKGSATEVMSFFMNLYTNLLENYGAENVTIVGDSNGGGIAHSLCQLLIKNNIKQPSQLVLLSPWLDLSLSNPLIEDTEDNDPLLDVEALRTLGKQYAADVELTDFRASPIYGNIRRVAPTTLFVGTHDIMLADSRKLRLKAESEPVVFNYLEFNGMFHDWMFFNFPDAKKAQAMIISQIKYPPSEAEMALNAGSDFWK
ncbi:alpha/beta hydrolase fold domain-containing protein [Gracilimonas sp. Q87]|uniref:alpha/beta hydrolase fold domain-containing protein n=1 Tax=Gracilimonas sp. Q87 TaxID=3384766 RepID=UPI003984213E